MFLELWSTFSISLVIPNSITIIIDGRRVVLFVREDATRLFRSSPSKPAAISSGNDYSESIKELNTDAAESEETMGSNCDGDTTEAFSAEESQDFKDKKASDSIMLFGEYIMSSKIPNETIESKARREGVVGLKGVESVFDSSLANIRNDNEGGGTGSSINGGISKCKHVVVFGSWFHNFGGFLKQVNSDNATGTCSKVVDSFNGWHNYGIPSPKPVNCLAEIHGGRFRRKRLKIKNLNELSRLGKGDCCNFLAGAKK